VLGVGRVGELDPFAREIQAYFQAARVGLFFDQDLQLLTACHPASVRLLCSGIRAATHRQYGHR